jgi:L-galactose dehydrogenase
MRYRALGKTGIEASIIGFGASTFGDVYGTVTPSAAERAVAVAIDRGINLFDVSPYYGLTLAEARLGQALEGKRSKIFLGTKCGRYGFDEFDFSGETLTRNFEQSLRRLKTDYVDLLQAHDIEFGHIGQILDETLPAMRRLQEQGKVRFLGLTGYWPGLLARTALQGNVDCVLNYCHGNLFVDDMAAELVPMTEQTAIGLLNASPLHMGLLADKPIPDWHPAPSSVRDAARQVRALCEAHRIDPAMLALRVCLDHPAVASTFVGISSESEVVAACNALEWTPPLEVLQQVRRIIEPVHNVVWRSGLEQNQNESFTSLGSHDASH